MIYENDKKSDRVDAEWLARVARLDAALLAPIRHRHSDSQAALALLRARDALVRARTQLVNHVRGTVKAFGVRLPRCSMQSFVKQATPGLPADLAPVLGSVVEAIEALTIEIRKYDRQIAAMADASYPETKRLRQVPGVGPVTALTFVQGQSAAVAFGDVLEVVEQGAHARIEQCACVEASVAISGQRAVFIASLRRGLHVYSGQTSFHSSVSNAGARFSAEGASTPGGISPPAW